MPLTFIIVEILHNLINSHNMNTYIIINMTEVEQNYNANVKKFA